MQVNLPTTRTRSATFRSRAATAPKPSHPTRTVFDMQLERGRYACERCARTFTRNPLGRRPLYCTRTCRQRAYEARRRGAEHHRLPATELAFPPEPPTRPDRPTPQPSPHGYEPGRGRTVTHALRPDGPADNRGRRPTLCGTTAQPLPVRRHFDIEPTSTPTCTTCRHIAQRHPLPRPIDPPAELARLKHLLRTPRPAIASGDPGAEHTLLEHLYRLTA